jgi:hypothetical protein
MLLFLWPILYLSSYSLQHLGNPSILASSSVQTEPTSCSPTPASTYVCSGPPATCCLSQRFIFHTYNPRFTTGVLNTFVQVNIMGVWYNIYNGHVTAYNLSSCASAWSLGRPAGPGLSCVGNRHCTCTFSTLRVSLFSLYFWGLQKLKHFPIHEEVFFSLSSFGLLKNDWLPWKIVFSLELGTKFPELLFWQYIFVINHYGPKGCV